MRRSRFETEAEFWARLEREDRERSRWLDQFKHPRCRFCGVRLGAAAASRGYCSDPACKRKSKCR